MPSALETLVKILKLEQESGLQDKAVIGGLKSFAAHWVIDAHAQAKKPEHHALVDELAALLDAYGNIVSPGERYEAVKYMLGRITGRVPPRGGDSPPAVAPTAEKTSPPAAAPTSATSERPPEVSAPPSAPPVQMPRPSRGDQQPERRREPSRTEPPPAHQQETVRPPATPAPPPIAEPEVKTEPPRPSSATVSAPAPTGPKIDQRPSRNQPSRQPSESYSEGPDPYDPSRGPDDLDSGPAESASEDQDEARPPRPEPARQAKPPRRKRPQRDPAQDAEILRHLKSPVTTIAGIGPKNAEKMAQLNLHTVEDMLFCFPRRYDDYTRMLPLSKVRPDEVVTVVGAVRDTVIIKGKRNIDVLNVVIDDGTGVLTVSFFNQPYLRARFERGTQVVFSGKTSRFLGKTTMSNPDWELLEREALHTRSIVPVYPLTKGVTAQVRRKFSRAAVDEWALQIPDSMPESVLERVDLPDLGWAIQQIHFPSSLDALELARHRLAFDELILLQLGVLRNRRRWQSQPGPSLSVEDDLLNTFAGSLPYTLTGAQTRAIQSIREDLARAIPMNRLLQGDVGSGKTVVATAAMLIAVQSGYQAVLMAPTGILAEQHFRAITRMITDFSQGRDQFINVKLLTGATPDKERAEILWGLGDGSINIVVGTHALLEEDVNFWRLGLAVIDEQHRFGVNQRGRLRGKGVNPHVLIMTATPIPRTLALTMYADLDLTILDEMPPGRMPIDTRVLFPKERERAYSFIDSQIAKGRQAFIIYPLVEASDDESMSEVRSAVEEFERLQTNVFSHRRLGLLHGRLSNTEKEAVMSAFSRGELDILVSTSVVEVGIDVPNATVILIEGANRFGLAQLHQFRGRVGRGEHPSYCLLISDSEADIAPANVDLLSDKLSATSNSRLRAMESTTDGFKLAEIDWELRGAGELLGTRQSGGSARLGDYMNIRLVENAQTEARTLYEEDPDLSLPEHLALRERLVLQFGDAFADMS